MYIWIYLIYIYIYIHIIYIYICILYVICLSTFHHQCTVGGTAQPAASKAKTAHSRSMAPRNVRSVSKGGSTWNPLGSSSKFALRNGLRGRNCCYTYNDLQRSFNIIQQSHAGLSVAIFFKQKLEKSKSQDHKNYHNTQAFLFEASALLFIPGWEVFISQLETYIELTGTTQNFSGQMRDGHLFAGRAWTSWTKPLQINMISHNCHITEKSWLFSICHTCWTYCYARQVSLFIHLQMSLLKPNRTFWF